MVNTLVDVVIIVVVAGLLATSLFIEPMLEKRKQKNRSKSDC